MNQFLTQSLVLLAITGLTFVTSELLKKYLKYQPTRELRSWQALECRLADLAVDKPEYAIEEAWPLIEKTILQGATGLETIDAARSQDIVAIAECLPDVTPVTIARLRGIQKMHNLVAYGANLTKHQTDLRAAVKDLLPVLMGLDYQLTAGSELGKANDRSSL
jgi:hypothetical protein